jgi:hypothetical protein
MRSIGVKDLERQRRASLIEEERARRMNAVFSETDALTDAALRGVKTKSWTKKTARKYPPLALGFGLGLTLVGGGALAYGGIEVSDLPPLFRGIFEAPLDTPNSRKAGSERSEDLREPHEHAKEHPSSNPKLRSAAFPDAPAKTAGELIVSRHRVDEPTSKNGDPTPKAQREGKVTLPTAPSESWGRLANALSREQIGEAQLEAEKLRLHGTREEREAAELVAVQIQIKKDGFLNATSRKRLEDLRVHAATLSSRREADRLLLEHH